MFYLILFQMDFQTNLEKQKILMKIKQYTLTLLCGLALTTSCNNDDDGDGPAVAPPRDRTQQQVIDKDSLLGYLSTHYYNSSLFLDGNDHSINDIVVTELAKDEEGNYIEDEAPENHTLLIDAVETHTTLYEEVNYEYYILRLNQGGGASPSFADNVRISYEGSLQNASIFDSSVNPTGLDMVGDGFNSSGVIEGWKLIIPDFNASESFEENGDGIVNYSNYGLGMMFIPSGLG